MKKKFTFLMALFALMLITLPGMVMGQSDYSAVYTSQDGLLSTAGGSNLTASTISIGGTIYDCIKGGTSSKAGVWKITVPSGTKYLHLHAAAYTGTSVTLTSSPTGYNVSLSDAASITGNPPFTFNQDASSANYYKVITFTTALANNLTITFTATGGKRFAVWGVNAEEESTATLASISLSGTYPTSFYQGDAFSHEGMIVTANYDDESSANVTSSATFSGYNMSTLGNQTVTVSYTENNVTKTQTYSITVNAIPCYTVTLSDDTENPLTEASAGAGVTLPSRSAIGDYSFFKWSETNVSTETTTAPATLIPAGTYHPTSNITLYPVYTRSESGSGTTDVPVSTTIAAYASANSWESGERYTSIILDENVTISGKSNGNNSKYYSTSPGTWRHYAGDSGEITVTTSSGTLKNVTITYSGNTLKYGESNVTSGTAINVSGTSAVFAVSGSSSNTQVSAIGVTYTISGSITTYYWSSPTQPAVATPGITAGANPFLFSTTATITCETAGAAIKYSFDGETWNDYSDALTITETTTVYAKAIKDANESSVASLEITKNLAEPTVTVSGDLIVDLDGETNVNAGTLSATVTYNNEAVTGATVTWGSNHTEIATIDESTGAVTLLTTGEVTFTATYAGNSDYSEASGTKTVTVVNSKAPGTVYNPYTVAQARTVISALSDNGTLDDKYVRGIISDVGSYNSTYSSITYWISDDGTESNELQVYSGKGIGGAAFTAATDLKVGDVVVVSGTLKKYVKNSTTTPEFDKNSAIESLIRPGTGSNPATIAGTVVDFTIANDENYIVASNTTLTVTGTLTNNGTAANLVIEDGGQLVTSNSVKATLKKTTTASTEAKTATTYWYAISSPIDEIAISTFATGTHNVYSYIEKSHYWNEYRGAENITLGTAPFTKLANGRGYLYRSTASGIDFKGDVNIEDATYTLSYTAENGDLAGFNLIGNPFSYNIYKGVDIPNTDLEGNFYTLTPSGGWELGYDSGATEPTAIKPNTGILVQAKSTANGQTLTIAKTRNGGVSKYENDQISFRVENSEYYDVACVQFKEGRGLNKVEHRNAEIPMLYIMNNGERFASACMPDNTSVINLGFEAKTMGEYTISLKAEGQYSYMHLIDKLTGEDIDMLVEDSYTFIGSQNDRKDRFVLNLNYNAAGIDSESDIFAYQSGSDVIVSGEGELQVFDITGRKVMTTNINGVQTVNGMNNGVYIFRLNGKAQKIVVR